jgi:uncharacterized protein YndB with AHSA1/START domain
MMTEPIRETLNLTLTRAFDAPATRVYAAWTETALVRRWWGPNGFTCHRADMDVRPGGTSIVGMRAPAEWGGFELLHAWTYRVVEAGRRLEFVLRFVGPDGAPVVPQSIGIPAGVPAEVPHTLAFRDLGPGRSELTIVEAGYTTNEALETSRSGLVETLDKLAEALRP